MKSKLKTFATVAIIGAALLIVLVVTIPCLLISKAFSS